MKFPIIIFLLVSFNLHSQFKRLKPASVKEEELEQTYNPIDSSNTSYYIFDIGESYIDLDYAKDLKLYHSRKLRIKILGSDWDDLANWSIPIRKSNNRHEDLLDIKVTVYNLINGKIKKEKMGGSFVEYQSIHPFLDAARFAIPQVQKGSIIEIEYSIRSPFINNYRSWEFQQEIPVLYSEYTTKIPDFLTFHTNIQGYIFINKHRLDNMNESYTTREAQSHVSLTGVRSTTDAATYSYTNELNTYVGHSVPAFVEEPYISTKNNFISKITFSLLSVQVRGEVKKDIASNWGVIENSYLKDDNFGKFLNREHDAQSILSHIITDEKTQSEKISKIYSSIRKQIKWNDHFSELSTEDSPQDLWRKAEGNSADLNLLLVMLCKQAGIHAFPILSSTRQHGYIFINNPSDMQFNHVIAGVILDSNLILMDLSGENNPPGLLPFHSLNNSGRALDEEPYWISLTPENVVKDKYFFQMKLLPEGKMEYKSKWQLADYSAIDFRQRIDCENRDEGKQLAVLRNEYPNLNINSFRAGTSGNTTQTIELNFTDGNCLQTAGNRLIVQINPLKSIYNPFTEEKRLYPIDFGTPLNKTFSYTMEIPQDYRYSAGPEAVNIQLPDNKGSFQYQLQSIGNMVQINYNFQINSSLFSNEDYPYIREFFTRAENKINEPIVLEKDL